MAELEHTRRLAWHNRQVLAERLRWPAGVLEACEQTEDAHPAWRISWDRRAQVYTAAHGERRLSFRHATAATIAELVEKMADLDARAAVQRAEWQRLTPPGWTTLGSQ